MKRKTEKQGISLIVLVITIIVMIILAATVVISLSQNGIIGKANDAVDQTNLKQVQQAATLAWADAYAGGARGVDDLKDAVDDALEAANVDVSKYEITVTTNGVTVVVKDTTTPPVEEPDEGDEEDTAPTQLSAPTLSLSEDTLTITDNAENGSYTAGFEVYVGEEKKATITASSSTTFDLTTLELAAGTYNITVKAVAAEDSTITASQASETVEYLVEEVSNVPEEWQAHVIAVTPDEVPIPKGFVASPYGADEVNGIPAENTKKGGLVIYQLTDDEITRGATSLPESETQYTSWTTRNQYVWVPVDKDKFTTEFVRKDFLNNTSQVVTSAGSYNTLGTSYWEVMVNQSTNLPLATLEEQNSKYMSVATLEEVQAMYASVKQYGGFYIARYEAGREEYKWNVVTTLANVHSKMNKIPYVGLEWNDSMNSDVGGAVEVARSLYTSNTADPSYSKYGVVSTLTYGVQWDRALQWFIDTEAMSRNEVTKAIGSTEYGNYYDHNISSYTELNEGARYYESKTFENVTADYTKINKRHILTTGALKAANINNIYDMAGNLTEWTMEGYTTFRRVGRGCCFYYAGTDYPISDRSGNAAGAGDMLDQWGIRTSLYIKI